MKLGIDNIDKHLNLFAGKRVGLITNPTGIDSNYHSTIDILSKKTNLVSLFSAEHGVRGDLQAGVNLENYTDDKYGIPVYSLYGETRKPTKSMLDELDVLCMDIQDGGSRFYTYVYTMAYSMIACSEQNKEFVVFDRPNPINGVDVDGNLLDIEYRSFIGYYPIVQRHGLTIGELANFFNKEFEINCKLNVVPMDGWDRRKYMDELDIPWVAPSPNFPTVNTGVCYNATCIFEGTNISEGRGTTTPFEVVGAPFIDPYLIADKMNELNIQGVVFRPTYFTPSFSKHEKTLCGGVQVHITNRGYFLPVHVGWALLDVIRHTYPNEFTINPPYKEGGKRMLELNTGCDYIVKDVYSLEEQLEILKKDTKTFIQKRARHLMY
jgi:uncharacterized protein YbbC (DUF1343 family)